MTVQAQADMTLSITRSAHSPIDFVQIVGDVDLSNTLELDLAARRLIADDASIIYVDLGGVTFMGSTLVAFLAHVCNSDDARRPMVLCRPSPMALRVVGMTGLDQLASVHAELPPQWPYRLAATQHTVPELAQRAQRKAALRRDRGSTVANNSHVSGCRPGPRRSP